MQPVLGNVARASDVVVATMNPRDDPDLVSEYDVRSVPKLLYFEDGELVDVEVLVLQFGVFLCCGVTRFLHEQVDVYPFPGKPFRNVVDMLLHTPIPVERVDGTRDYRHIHGREFGIQLLKYAGIPGRGDDVRYRRGIRRR
jgi:hypothetical protein